MSASSKKPEPQRQRQNAMIAYVARGPCLLCKKAPAWGASVFLVSDSWKVDPNVPINKRKNLVYAICQECSERTKDDPKSQPGCALEDYHILERAVIECPHLTSIDIAELGQKPPTSMHFTYIGELSAEIRAFEFELLGHGLQVWRNFKHNV